MKTITTTVYEFNELSDAAKEKARDWYRSICAGDSDFAEHIIDEAVEQGKLLGITFKTHAVKLYGGGTRDEPCIWWSGFSSQGDGACFEGTWKACDIKADKVAEGWGECEATTEIKRIASKLEAVAKKYPNCRIVSTHRSRYCHSHSVDFDFDSGIEDDDQNAAAHEDVENNLDLTDSLRDFMNWIYRQLEKEYEYQNSNECVDE